MRTRLFLAVVCILVLPFVFSPAAGDKLGNSTPYATVAFAGHTTSSGAWCACGEPGCICDPGEGGGGNGNYRTPAPGKTDGFAARGASPSPTADLGTGAMLFALALFAWLRFRA